MTSISAPADCPVQIDDAVRRILWPVGYRPVLVYEKWSAEYAGAVGNCVLAETPICVFAELEGPEEWIEAVSARFGLQPRSLLTLSYGWLFESWREETGSPARKVAAICGGALMAAE